MNEIDGSSDSLELRVGLTPELPGCSESLASPPNVERQDTAIKVDHKPPAAEHLADYGQVEEQDGAGCVPPSSNQRTPRPGHLRRPPRYLDEYVRHTRRIVLSKDMADGVSSGKNFLVIVSVRLK